MSRYLSRCSLPRSLPQIEFVGRLLEARAPWSAFLEIGPKGWDSCPEIEALVSMATSESGLIGIESIAPLTPVCQAFKALVKVVEDAPEAQGKLKPQGVVSWCAFLTRVFIKLGKAAYERPQYSSSLRKFGSTMGMLVNHIRDISVRSKIAALLHARIDARDIAGFERDFRGIWADVRGLALLDVMAMLEEVRRTHAVP